jgi:hypothetical protein
MIKRPFAYASIITVLGAIGLIVGLALDATATAFAYLAAFSFGFSLAIGALLLVIIETITGARWFVALRRIGEIIAVTFPLFAVLFIPVIVAMPVLYPWLRTWELEPSIRIRVEHAAPYLDPKFFIARAALAFGVWIVLSELFHVTSLKQALDAGRMTMRLRRLSAAAIWPIAVTLTFACFDWFMSLDPAWPSTIYGIYYFSGAIAAAASILVLIALYMELNGLFGAHLRSDHYHALGRIQLTFLLFWAYAAFVQLLIIWMADLPEESAYYVKRFVEPWRAVGLFVIIAGFFAPFLALLSQPLKRNRFLLAGVSVWILAGHYADLAFAILPAAPTGKPDTPWLDVAALGFVLGAGAAFALMRARNKPPIAAQDPLIAVSMRYESP